MAGEVYAYGVLRLPLLDSDGATIGRIDDVVVLPGTPQSAIAEADAPTVVGFVASSQRRRIFVNAATLASLDGKGLRLRSSLVDVKPFKRRPGELLVAKDILDRRVGIETVSDVGLRPVPARTATWEVSKVMLSSRAGIRRRRRSRLVPWTDVASLFATDPVAMEAARLRDLEPFDVAARVRNLPPAQRKQLIEKMEDESLADLLEELPEAEQVRIIESLDIERLVDVLEEMEYDDAADLLAEMPREQREQVLEAMDDEERDVMERLLSYGEGTAGSLLTPDPVILPASATVAEALAHVREEDVLVPFATQVFVVEPPFVAPTGRYLGVAHIQRLLREAPSTELRHVVEDEPSISPDLPDRDVAERLAAYNLLAIAVCDDAGRLLGAVSVDDVLDRVLPVGWRQRQRAVSGSSASGSR
jgi:CBS domain-containing protein